MEDGGIPDSRITASSELDHYHGSRNARLNHLSPVTGSWSAKTNDLNQWIQADLVELKQVSGVVTQGRNAFGQQWVTKFIVQCSDNSDIWSYIEDVNGQVVRI